MKKEYFKPEIKIEMIEAEQLLDASEPQIEKTEDSAGEEYEVLSKEHHGSFWDE
jgi:hypothetical protein